MARRFHAGKLRHRVTIQRKQVTQNGFGEEVITWVDVGDFWASVEPIRGREFVELKQAQAEISHRVRMRPTSAVSASMRVLFEGRELYIIAPPIEVNEAGREMHLMCSERTAD